MRKKTKTIDKTKAQRIHFKNRALERYGLNINRHDYREIVERIQRGESSVLERQSNRVSVHFMMVKGEPMRIVYDHQRKTAVTCLPKPEPLSPALSVTAATESA